jgi:hypothetical protein
MCCLPYRRSEDVPKPRATERKGEPEASGELRKETGDGQEEPTH